MKASGVLFAAAFEFADEFGGEAEIGGDHVLGDALDEFGKAVGEAEVAFFAGIGLHEEAVLLGGGEGALNDEAEVAVDLGKTIAEERDAIPVEDGESGRFDGLDVETGGLLPVETLKVGDPPVLDGELCDLFHAVFADEIHAGATFEHEIIGHANLALPEKEFLFFELAVTDMRSEHGGLVVVKGNIFPHVGDERSKLIHWANY